MNSDLFSQYPETAVLATILQRGEKIDDLHELKPFMFTSSVNKSLFNFLLSIRMDGLIPDYGLVISKLQEHGKINECGGESYLKYLFSQPFNDANLPEFSSYIVNSYKARQLVNLATSLPSQISDISNIDSIIGALRHSLDELGSILPEVTTDITSLTKGAWNDLIEKANNPNKIDFTTGISKLDAVTGGFWQGELWVVAGRPGHGKTSFLCNSILSGIPSLVFSLEMGSKSLLNRLWSIKSGVPIFDMRVGQVTQADINKIAQAAAEIKEYPIYIDSSYINSLEQVISIIRKHHRLYGIQVVHIDYLQLLAERTNDATNELGRITRALKLLSKDLDIAITCYSQLNRSVELRQDKRPLLSDLRQSGNIEEDCDLAVFLYRDELYNRDTKHKGVMELLINKHRQGPIGVITTKFQNETNRIICE